MKQPSVLQLLGLLLFCACLAEAGGPGACINFFSNCAACLGSAGSPHNCAWCSSGTTRCVDYSTAETYCQSTDYTTVAYNCPIDDSSDDGGSGDTTVEPMPSVPPTPSPSPGVEQQGDGSNCTSKSCSECQVDSLCSVCATSSNNGTLVYSCVDASQYYSQCYYPHAGEGNVVLNPAVCPISWCSTPGVFSDNLYGTILTINDPVPTTTTIAGLIVDTLNTLNANSSQLCIGPQNVQVAISNSPTYSQSKRQNSPMEIATVSYILVKISTLMLSSSYNISGDILALQLGLALQNNSDMLGPAITVLSIPPVQLSNSSNSTGGSDSEQSSPPPPPSPSSTPSASSHTNTAAIVGTVLGGVAFMILVAVAVGVSIYCTRKQKSPSKPKRKEAAPIGADIEQGLKTRRHQYPPKPKYHSKKSSSRHTKDLPPLTDPSLYSPSIRQQLGPPSKGQSPTFVIT